MAVHPTPPISVLIADDHLHVRTWLRLVLEAADDIVVVGEAADAAEAVELARTLQPDIAILDVWMPRGGGVEGASFLRLFAEDTKVIVYSGDDDPATVLRLIEAGARSYLVKRGDGDEVIAAIRAVAGGGVHLSAGVDTALVDELATRLAMRTSDARRHERVRGLVDDVLDRRAVRVEFQPIVGLASGNVQGFEALARIDSPRKQSPDVWFKDAASVGRLCELETLAATTAVAALDHLDRELFLAINVSAEMATDPRLRTLLDDVPLERIVLELTEHAAVDDYERLNTALDPLRARGLRVAIDDVGAGYSTMAHVLRLAPHIIKLDRSLVAGIERHPARQAFVRSMVAFAHDVGSYLLAEGIETLPELDVMRGAGVTLGQGFYFARPAPLDRVLVARASLAGSW